MNEDKSQKKTLHDVMTSVHGNTTVADLMEGIENGSKNTACKVFTSWKVSSINKLNLGSKFYKD